MFTEVQVMRWYKNLYHKMRQRYPGQVWGFDQRTLAITGGQGWLNAITRLERMQEKSFK